MQRVQVAACCSRRISIAASRCISSSRMLYDDNSRAPPRAPILPTDKDSLSIRKETGGPSWKEKFKARTTAATTASPQPSSSQSSTQVTRSGQAKTPFIPRRGGNTARSPASRSRPATGAPGQASRTPRSPRPQQTPSSEDHPIALTPFVEDQVDAIDQSTTKSHSEDSKEPVQFDYPGLITEIDDPALIALHMRREDLLEAYENGSLQVTEEGIRHLASPFEQDNEFELEEQLEAHWDKQVKELMKERHISESEAWDVLEAEEGKERAFMEEKAGGNAMDDLEYNQSPEMLVLHGAVDKEFAHIQSAREARRQRRAQIEAVREKAHLRLPAGEAARIKSPKEAQKEDVPKMKDQLTGPVVDEVGLRADQVKELLSEDTSWIMKIMDQHDGRRAATQHVLAEELTRMDLRERYIDNARAKAMAGRLQTEIPYKRKSIAAYSEYNVLLQKTRSSNSELMAKLLANNPTASLKDKQVLAENVDQILSPRRRTPSTAVAELQS